VVFTTPYGSPSQPDTAHSGHPWRSRRGEPAPYAGAAMSDRPAATSGQDAPNAAATAPITVEQVAAILGVSITTVKRRIRAGTLRAEQAQRPQGTVWLVYLDPAATPAAEERPPAAGVVATAAATPNGQADAMVSLIQTTIGTVLGPLVGELAASRQTIERHGETIRGQAEQLGALNERLGSITAELDALRAQNGAVERSGAPDADPSPALLPPTPWWSAVITIMVFATMGAVVLLLAWPK
jgi:hypothetical protein